jgi:hypothetical protein
MHTARLTLLGIFATFSFGAAIDPNSGTNFTVNGLTYTGVGNNGGFSINDAEFPGNVDAFDNAGILRINGTTYFAPNPSDLTGDLYTGGALPVGGLSVMYSLYFDASTGWVRAIATITNTTGLGIATDVEWLTNAGSDGSTVITATQSGDLIFTTADRWITNTEGGTALAPGDTDPPFLLTFFGPGAAVTPSSVTTTVFSNSGTEGYGATYSLNIGAGQTVRLMWLLTIAGDTGTLRTTTAAAIDGITSGSSILAGLSGDDLASIQNYKFGGQVVPEPSTVLLSAAGLLLAAARIRRK